MRKLPYLTLSLAFLSAPLTEVAFTQTPAPARESTALEQEVEKLYNEATDFFNKADYEATLKNLALIHQKTNDREFERVMFLEAASYYNLEKFEDSKRLLTKFVSTYPNSEVLNEAKISLGRTLLKLKEEEAGIKMLREVANVPTMRDLAGLDIALYYKDNKKDTEALEILEFIIKEINAAPNASQQQAILMAAEIYLGSGDSDQASIMIEKLRSGASADDSIVQLNNLAVKVGDKMLEEKRYREALLSYQSVRRHSEIARLQRNRIAEIEGWIKQLKAGRKVTYLGRNLALEDAENLLEGNQHVLEEINKAKDYDAAIFYKLGQSFYEMGRYYESILAFEEIYYKFPEFSERARSLFGVIVGYVALQQHDRAYELCERYLNLHADSENASQVTEMLGGLAYETGKIDAAIRAFQKAIDNPNSDKERLSYLLGVVLFESQRFDESRAALQNLLTASPETSYKDEAFYRIALTYFFQNDSVGTRRALNDYIAKNPKGVFIVDAKYRLAFIEFQAATSGQGGNRAKARKDLEALIEEAPNDPNIGQVYYLLGDIYSQMPPGESTDPDYSELALNAYRNAVEKAKSDDVLNFALESANNMMLDRGMWKEISEMWSAYYAAHEGTPNALKAIHWISRAHEREAKQLANNGQPEASEAKLDQARTLVAKAAFPYLGNPNNEQVEMLLNQLVAMVLPKKRSRNGEGVSIEELEQKFTKLLLPEGDTSIVNGTAAARVLYARATIARSMRNIPRYDNLISIIPDAAKAEELSPVLLATLADMLFKRGDYDRAKEYYEMIRLKYPSSEYGDKAPVGLGSIAFEYEQYDEALKLFDEAIEKYAASSSLSEAYLGKARTMFATKRYDEAYELYNVIRNTKEWRGEGTAIAFYMLGQIEESRGKMEDALAFYQRCYLTQRRFKPWLAKSYLQAAKVLQKINRQSEARDLLTQMLARTDIKDEPEFAEAQRLLSQLPAA